MHKLRQASMTHSITLISPDWNIYWKGIKYEQASKMLHLNNYPSNSSRGKTSPGPTNSRPNTAILWAACCMGFFGFLCCVEFICSSMHAYGSHVHFNLSNIALDSIINLMAIRVTIKQSKTDLFCRGIEVFLGHTRPHSFIHCPGWHLPV